jgi:hypothetical protein
MPIYKSGRGGDALEANLAASMAVACRLGRGGETPEASSLAPHRIHALWPSPRPPLSHPPPSPHADAGLHIEKERFLTEEEHYRLEGMSMSRDAWRGARAWEIYGVGEARR